MNKRPFAQYEIYDVEVKKPKWWQFWKGYETTYRFKHITNVNLKEKKDD